VPNFPSPPAAPLNTERLALRQLDLPWLDEVEAMVNEPTSQSLTATTQKFSRAVLHDWLATRKTQTNRADWAILHQESGEFLGEVVLNEFDAKTNSMNLRISLADPRFYNQGFGTEAMEAVLGFAFDTLDLGKVTLSVLVNNPRAISAYKKLGFIPGREYNAGQLRGVKFRFLRMAVNKLQFIDAISQREMAKHLVTDPAAPNSWSFAFDSGKRRAGLCDYTNRRISLSKHLVLLHTVDEARQVLWHEIAHALCGKAEGHGKVWLATAKKLGYRADKFTGNKIAANTARWVGECPAGHEHFRYKRPTRPLSCGICGNGYSKQYLIRWTERA
jgi:RimJ/RimL family protein N-acetyltransferase/predicted SprT family Zn-dependent metalloprotease